VPVPVQAAEADRAPSFSVAEAFLAHWKNPSIQC